MNPRPLPSQKILQELFDYDPQGFLRWKHTARAKKAGAIAGCVHPDGYRKIGVNGVKYPAHRLVFQWHYGTCPKSLDHVNRDRDDNRIENLREADPSQSVWNRDGWSASGHKNIEVTPSGTYRAKISFHGQLFRKTFKTLEEAIAYATNQREQLHGDFATHGCL